MRLYIAGGSDERLTVVRPFVDRMIARGVTITHDWTRCESYDRACTDEDMRACALADAEGVESAELVWIIVPSNKSEGSATEIGIARGRKIPFIASGPRALGNVFALLAARIFGTHEQAFDAMVTVQGVDDAFMKEARPMRELRRQEKTEPT